MSLSNTHPSTLMKSILRILLLLGVTALVLIAQAQVRSTTTPARSAHPAPAPADAPTVTVTPLPAPTSVPPPAPESVPVTPVAPVVLAASPQPAPAPVIPVTPVRSLDSAPLPAPAPLPAAPVSDANAPNPSSELVPLILIDDVPLLDAVKNLARQADLNFQFDPRVNAMSNQPNVTIRFENVTAEDALNAVLDNYGLTLESDPRTRISKIQPKNPKAEEPLLTQVIQLKYCSPTNLVPILKATLSQRSQVLPDPRTSQIIVMTTEKEMIELEKLVEQLDTPTKQVLIEAQLWETTKSPQTIKGIDWSGTLSAQHFSFGNGQTQGTVETQTPGASSTTVYPGGRTVATSGGSSTMQDLITQVGDGGFGLNTAMGLNPATAFLNADGLHAVLSFLNSDSDTELVATPRAVTLDNETANLDVSRAYPVYKITPGSANSPAGAEITWTNVGVILRVTPRISANSNIALHVMPEVSDIAAVDKQTINGQEYTANIYGIRRVETHVMIPSGSTLVMGGLINDHSLQSHTKIPLLGDLPGIGLLFRQDKKQRDKSNLMIFVTPTIIEDGDLQINPRSGFLKARFKPEASDAPPSAWDTGKPYDWTKPTYNPDGPKSKSFEDGHH